MKVAVMRFSSPYTTFIIDGNTETRSSGLNYLIYKDERKLEREFIIGDDVKPITLSESGFLGREKLTPLYIMARDNFISVETIQEKGQPVVVMPSNDIFKVTGEITKEQIINIADWGMIEALIRATKSKDMFSGWFGKIMIVLVVIAVLVGVYLFLNWLTGGQISIPKLW